MKAEKRNQIRLNMDDKNLDHQSVVWNNSAMPILLMQEIEYENIESEYFFQIPERVPFLATPAVIRMYQKEVLWECLMLLQNMAIRFDGLDHVQVFEDIDKPEGILFQQDLIGGYITARLLSEK